jgi:phytoene dehydrogenase-like protein
MSIRSSYDAVVIGSGPNGLAAAITLAQSGCSVLVLEAHETIGGGCRTKELTLPGFLHDVCSAVHPFGLNSPFFRQLPLEQYGLEWIEAPSALAHPLDDGPAMLLEQSIATTAATLGEDAEAYRRTWNPLVSNWSALERAFLGPLRLSPILTHPFATGLFGLQALLSARQFTDLHFRGPRASALFAGIAAHSLLTLEQTTSAAAGLLLSTVGHVVGWPIPRAGSQSIVDALAAHLRSLGGEIVTGIEVKDIDELPSARALLFDVSPLQLLRIARKRLPAAYCRSLERFRYGPGAFKVDFALDGPIPWKAEECRRAVTVHLGGTFSEIALSERQVARGEYPERPYVLLAQQSLFDASRAPSGKHTVWAYCHVPNGSNFSMTQRIEAQIERFAPGFRERILHKHISGPMQLEAYNANYVGGDINSGKQDLRQLFTRPTLRLNPYTTPVREIYLCSSSTPPGGGVHGMCGYFAAQAALHRVFS